MSVLLKFFSAVLVWAAVLLVLLSGVSLVGGGSISSVLGHLPVWGGLALVLSAFPGGVAVVDAVLPPTGGLDLRSFGIAAGAVAAVAVITFLLVAYIGPAAVRAGTADGVDAEASAMTLGTLRAEAQRAALEVEAAVGVDGLSLDWQAANILVWHYTRRLAGVVQPFLFAAIGLLVAFWGRRMQRGEVAQVFYWMVGLFLVCSTYLAGENSFELVVLQAAGPVFFAGLFVLIVPPVLLLGLGVPTAVALWTGEVAGSET